MADNSQQVVLVYLGDSSEEQLAAALGKVGQPRAIGV